jgi:glutaredoxin
MLHEAGIEFDELVLNRDYRETTIRAVTGRTSVPQIFINGEYIGGSDELESWMKGKSQQAA